MSFTVLPPPADLFEAAARREQLRKGPRSIEERFQVFHDEHPEVFAALVELTEQAQRAGRRHIGIRMLWERLRWTMTIEQKLGEFKLNDHFHSRYVRKLIEEHPEFEGLFELRELKAV